MRDGVAVELADARSDRLDVGVRVGVGLRVRERVADAVADAAATGGGSVSLTKMDMVEVIVGSPQHPFVAAPA